MKNLLNQLVALICIISVTVSCADKSEKVNDNKIYNASELTKQPEFPGGEWKLNHLVDLEFRIPELEEDISTKIVVSFIIETDGSMTNYKLVEDPGLGLGDEAIRMLKSFKYKWKPGEVDGKPVRSLYTFPIPMNIRV